MISFFRKIRQKLLAGKQITQYLGYAIGEILLVMVGILIALQVNNWNQGRISDKVELQLLLELKNTLTSDYRLTQRTIDGNKRAELSSRVVLRHLEENIPNHDSLSSHFEHSIGWWEHLVNTGAYENAKRYGLEFIDNAILRYRLARFYERRVMFTVTRDERQSAYHFNTVIPVVSEFFESTMKYDEQSGLTPYDYSYLGSSRRYKNILRTNIGRRQSDNEWISTNLRIMRELEPLIQQEIDNR